VKWVAITGGIGTGKSSLASKLRALGYPVLDADEIAKSVTNRPTALEQLRTEVSSEIFDSEGKLDRIRLGKEIFQNASLRKKVEKIIHPLVRDEFLQQKASAESSSAKEFGFYDVPLLFENNLQADFFATVVVVSSEKEQIDRLKKRMGLSEAEVRSRISAQMPLEEKRKLATYVVENSGAFEDLDGKTEELVEFLQGKSAASEK